MLIYYLKLIRPKHWLKNGFVLLAIVFAGKLLDVDSLINTSLALVSYCLLASGIYVVNDILDSESDKKHPVKKHRPIASGKISKNNAGILGVLLLFSGFSLSFFINTPFFILAILYVVMMVLYSFGLKKVVGLDLLIVSIGFVIRAAAGALAIDVKFSPWLFVSALFLALFLIIGKRRNELEVLKETAKNHRKSLNSYSVDMLNQLLGVSASASLLSYTLYTLNLSTIERFGTDSLYLTLPIVVYGFFRYFYLVFKKDLGGDPANTLLSDRPLILTIMLWVLSVIGIIYAA